MLPLINVFKTSETHKNLLRYVLLLEFGGKIYNTKEMVIQLALSCDWVLFCVYYLEQFFLVVATMYCWSLIFALNSKEDLP